jgi:hypothetical protein
MKVTKAKALQQEAYVLFYEQVFKPNPKVTARVCSSAHTCSVNMALFRKPFKMPIYQCRIGILNVTQQ